MADVHVNDERRNTGRDVARDGCPDDVEPFLAIRVFDHTSIEE